MTTIQTTKQSTKNIRFIIKKKRKFNVRPRKEAVHLPTEIWDMIYNFKLILEQRGRMNLVLPILKNIWVSAITDSEANTEIFLNTGVYFKGRSESSKADNDYGWTHQRISISGLHIKTRNNIEVRYLRNLTNYAGEYIHPIKQNIGKRWVPFVESKSYLGDEEFQDYFQQMRDDGYWSEDWERQNEETYY